MPPNREPESGNLPGNEAYGEYERRVHEAYEGLFASFLRSSEPQSEQSGRPA